MAIHVVGKHKVRLRVSSCWPVPARVAACSITCHFSNADAYLDRVRNEGEQPASFGPQAPGGDQTKDVIAQLQSNRLVLPGGLEWKWASHHCAALFSLQPHLSSHDAGKMQRIATPCHGSFSTARQGSNGNERGASCTDTTAGGIGQFSWRWHWRKGEAARHQLGQGRADTGGPATVLMLDASYLGPSKGNPSRAETKDERVAARGRSDQRERIAAGRMAESRQNGSSARLPGGSCAWGLVSASSCFIPGQWHVIARFSVIER
jgi:hypothetical protein